jgi:hypothetical protein
MNKQELIEKNANSDRVYGEKNYVALEDVLVLVKQLDEPQKVKVSEEEAKFLETFDFNCESDVTKALYYISRVGFGYYLKNNDGIELKDLSEGFRELENRKRLIKAILDGYEVEKEKRYEVILCNGQSLKTVYRQGEDHLGFEKVYGNLERFTRKQLEDADFGWVFDCEGIEIEEVE